MNDALFAEETTMHHAAMIEALGLRPGAKATFVGLPYRMPSGEYMSLGTLMVVIEVCPPKVLARLINSVIEIEIPWMSLYIAPQDCAAQYSTYDIIENGSPKSIMQQIAQVHGLLPPQEMLSSLETDSDICGVDGSLPKESSRILRELSGMRVGTWGVTTFEIRQDRLEHIVFGYSQYYLLSHLDNEGIYITLEWAPDESYAYQRPLKIPWWLFHPLEPCLMEGERLLQIRTRDKIKYIAYGEAVALGLVPKPLVERGSFWRDEGKTLKLVITRQRGL